MLESGGCTNKVSGQVKTIGRLEKYRQKLREREEKMKSKDNREAEQFYIFEDDGDQSLQYKDTGSKVGPWPNAEVEGEASTRINDKGNSDNETGVGNKSPKLQKNVPGRKEEEREATHRNANQKKLSLQDDLLITETSSRAITHKESGHLQTSTETNTTDDSKMGRLERYRKKILDNKKNEKTAMADPAEKPTRKRTRMGTPHVDDSQMKVNFTQKTSHTYTMGADVREVSNANAQATEPMLPMNTKNSTYKIFDKIPFLSADELDGNEPKVENKEKLEEFKRRAGVVPTTTIQRPEKTMSRGKALCELSAKHQQLHKSAEGESGIRANSIWKKRGQLLHGVGANTCRAKRTIHSA